jgi:hypothetical protein
MPYRATLLDVSLTRAVDPPHFAMGQQVVQVIEAIHEEVSKQFAISLTDIHGLPGNSMADVGLRGTMFSGQLSFECSVQRFSVDAKGLRSQPDLEVVIKCAALLQQAVQKTLSGLRFGKTSIVINGWLANTAPGQTVGAEQILAKFNTAPQLSLVEGETADYPGRCRLQSSDGGYMAELYLDKSAVSQADLYFRAAIDLEPKSAFFDFPMISVFADGIVQRWLAHCGIPLVNQ